MAAVVSTPHGTLMSLSVEEANALSAVLRHVGGLPETTRRGLIQRILEGLTAAGVDEAQPYSEHPDLEGTLRFS